jgi:hypothetical protein
MTEREIIATIMDEIPGAELLENYPEGGALGIASDAPIQCIEEAVARGLRGAQLHADPDNPDTPDIVFWVNVKPEPPTAWPRPERDLETLGRAELLAIVQQIQEILWLYLDEDRPPGDVWNPEKEWDSETIEHVAAVLEEAGLAPTRREMRP